MLHRIRWIILLVIGVLWIVFVLQNTEVVSVRFLVFELSMSRVILLILTTLIGFVFGYMSHVFRQFRQNKDS